MSTAELSTVEKRAWLTLLSMCPPYLVYFAIQAAWPGLLPSFMDRIACLAAVALTHAALYIAGMVVMARQDRGVTLHEDERDLLIDARAARAAYYLMLSGLILVGMVMPFLHAGWTLVNAALLVIVLAEALRAVLTIAGYRRAPRTA